MINRDVKINIRKITDYTGAFNTPVYSTDKFVYGTLKDSGAEEKERAKAAGYENTIRVDINEEEFDGETEAVLNDANYSIYKYAAARNKVYLYLTNSEKG